MYSHRGRYLQALAMVAQGGLDPATVFLWTLPMFHCNGWCYPWAVTAAGGVHVALRQVRPEAVWTAIRDQGITHLNAAPTVLTMLAADPGAAPATGAGARRRRRCAPVTEPSCPPVRVEPPRDASLRADRELRTCNHLRLATRVGFVARR